MDAAEQHQPPTRQVPRSEEYEPPGPDDADQGPVPTDEPAAGGDPA